MADATRAADRDELLQLLAIPSVASVDDMQKNADALSEMFRKRGFTVELWGENAPVVYARLDVPVSIGLSIANFDTNQHGPNENLRIGNLWEGIEMLETAHLRSESHRSRACNGCVSCRCDWCGLANDSGNHASLEDCVERCRARCMP